MGNGLEVLPSCHNLVNTACTQEKLAGENFGESLKAVGKGISYSQCICQIRFWCICEY